MISEAVSVEGRGRELFDMMCAHDIEGIVAKRLADPLRTPREVVENQKLGLLGRARGTGFTRLTGALRPNFGPPG